MERDIQSNWTSIMNSIKNDYGITNAAFNTFFSAMSFYSYENNIVTICVDDKRVGEQSVNFIKNNYGIFIKVALSEFLDEDISVELVTKTYISNLNSINPIQNSTINNRYSFLNENYTFDTFVEGSNNSIAKSFSLVVAEAPGTDINPFFIYGGVGLGKTHLLHSIAHHILNNNPSAKLLYVTTENFMNEYVLALRNHTMDDFHEKYRNLDVMIIDDIQFISRKSGLQEEFFHTFNDLFDNKKQIIMAADRPPKDIEDLEDRLRTRFDLGVIVQIEVPDLETRLAILLKKTENFSLTNNKDYDLEILTYLAENIKSNIRDLEGALKKLTMLSKLTHKPITMALAKESIKEYLSIDENIQIVTIEYIVNTVCEYYGVTTDEIYSHNRSKNVSYPRQIIMYLCKTCTSSTVSDIGKSLGDRDHSTILHGIAKIEDDLKTNQNLKNTLTILTNKIKPSEHKI